MKHFLTKSLSLLIVKIFLTSLSLSAQDCGDFRFENIRDTMVTNFMWPDTNPGFAFEMYYDTLRTANTFYTSFFMTDLSGDTISHPDYYRWSYYFPVIKGQRETYTLVLDSTLNTFPLPFEGFLLTENPECKIPLTFLATSAGGIRHKNAEVNLYPNPARQLIYIDGLSEGDNIIIYNDKGQADHCEIYSANGIDISQLTPGKYVVIVEKKSGFIVRESFIKVKE